LFAYTGCKREDLLLLKDNGMSHFAVITVIFQLNHKKQNIHHILDGTYSVSEQKKDSD